MNPNEVRNKSDQELQKLGGELKEDVFRLRFRSKASQLKQTSNIRKTKRELARVMTILRERELKNGKEAK